MFATTDSKSRTAASGSASFRTGTSARSASIASFACSRSRPSGPSRMNPSCETVTTVWASRSTTFSLRNSASSCAARSPSLATDRLRGAHLLGVDLLQRRALLVPCDLPLGGVRPGNGEVRRGAELLGDRERPLDQPLDRRPRRPGLARPEVEQLAGEPVADRAP